MNRATNNAVFAALHSRGMGRFVALNLMRMRGKAAGTLIASGASADEAADYLQRWENKARENTPRYRRRRKALFGKWAGMVKTDCTISY